MYKSVCILQHNQGVSYGYITHNGHKRVDANMLLAVATPSLKTSMNYHMYSCFIYLLFSKLTTLHFWFIFWNFNKTWQLLNFFCSEQSMFLYQCMLIFIYIQKKKNVHAMTVSYTGKEISNVAGSALWMIKHTRLQYMYGYQCLYCVFMTCNIVPYDNTCIMIGKLRHPSLIVLALYLCYF